jgi:prepilin-type N-terminal cleavage/methylation domain-containing protein
MHHLVMGFGRIEMRFDSYGGPMSGKQGNSAGFTLIEMMVSMVIFTVVFLSVLGLLEVARKGRTSTMQRSENLQNARASLRQMNVDVLNAGVDYNNASAPLLPNNWLNTHLGLPTSNPVATPATLDGLPAVIPGPGTILTFGAKVPNSRLTNTTSGTSVVTTTDQLTIVSVNHAFNSGNPVMIDGSTAVGCSGNAPAPTAAGEVVSAAGQTATLQITCPVGNGSSTAPVCNVGDIYCIQWANAQVTGIVTSLATVTATTDSIVLAGGSPDPLGLNTFVTGEYDIGSITNPLRPPTSPFTSTPLVAYAYKITMVTYYVLDDGSGQGTGTLMRRLYGGATGGAAIAYTDEPLAYGVTNLAFTYNLQSAVSTSFETGATFAPVGITTAAMIANFQGIRQISATITVQSPTKDPNTNKPYLETLTSVMNCRNLGYEQ